jgi:GIY-YIG catalytic domain
LKSKFANSGYPLQLLNDKINKGAAIPRINTLQYKSESEKNKAKESFLKGKSFLPLIIPFHSTLAAHRFRAALEIEWNNCLSKDVDISGTFRDEMPQLVFKRGVTVANILSRTKFLSRIDIETIGTLNALLNENVNVSTSVSKCNKPRCLCCEHIQCISSSTGTDETVKFNIEGSFNCDSKDIIYLITCSKCRIHYIGQTGRRLKDRLNNHRSDIRLNKDTAVAKHFSLPRHSCKDLKIVPIFSLVGKDFNERLAIEKQFMNTLNTIYPYGLN